MIETDLGHTCSNPDVLHQACRYQQPEWLPGSTEPWIADLLASLLLASGQTNVLEIGGYYGHTSQILLATLDAIGGGTLTVIDNDPAMCQRIRQRLNPLRSQVYIHEGDSLPFLDTLPDRALGFVFVDGNHSVDYVNQEILALRPKTRNGGILTFHDVHGNFQLYHLVAHYGGIALDLPRVSSSGGLGIIQLSTEHRAIPPATATRHILEDGNIHYRIVKPTHS